MNPKITFLGPHLGTTFSGIAYENYHHVFKAPPVNENNYLPAKRNEEVVDMVIERGGYGAIAMDTDASGRVEKSLASFIRLLQKYENPSDCPIGIFGAVKMKTSFALMTGNEDGDIKSIETIVTHEKGFLACRQNIKLLGEKNKRKINVVIVDTNGEATEIAAKKRDTRWAVLAPENARNKYERLFVHNEAFEDKPTKTLFFFIGPKDHPVVQREGEKCRALMVFDLHDTPGAIMNAQKPFADEGINTDAIQSLKLPDEKLHFALGAECDTDRIVSMKKAMKGLEIWARRSISFGPFPVIER